MSERKARIALDKTETNGVLLLLGRKGMEIESYRLLGFALISPTIRLWWLDPKAMYRLSGVRRLLFRLLTINKGV